MRTSELRDLYESPGPFASVLVDVTHDTETGAQQHALRVREACDRLAEQGAPNHVVDDVAGQLSEPVGQPAPVARVVVASDKGVQYDETTAGVRVDRPVATWAPLPDLGAWIAHRDSRVTFVLAVVDHVGGDVSVHASDAPDPEEEATVGGETQYVHQIGVGGWSAFRFQRSTEKVWKDNAEDVVAEITAQVRAGHHLVLLAGDPKSVGLVRAGLESVPATVVELASGSRAEDGGEEAMQEAIRDALREQVVSRRVELVHELRERQGREYAVAGGVDDVVEAFVRGQVETLLLDPDALADRELDPADHPGLVLGTDTVEGSVRTDLALVAAAVLTDAEVTVASLRTLGGVPAAALLRWDETAG